MRSAAVCQPAKGGETLSRSRGSAGNFRVRFCECRLNCELRDFFSLQLPAFCNNLNSMDGPLCALADASRQYQALLEVSQSVASHRDLTALFRDLVERLPRVVSFDSLWLVLHDPARNRMRLHVLEGSARGNRRGQCVAARKAHGRIAQRAGVEHAGAAGGLRPRRGSALP